MVVPLVVVWVRTQVSHGIDQKQSTAGGAAGARGPASGERVVEPPGVAHLTDQVLTLPP